MRRQMGMLLLAVFVMCALTAGWVPTGAAFGEQSPEQSTKNKVTRGAAKPITVPLGIRVKGSRPDEEIRVVDLTVMEDGELQENLSMRSTFTNSPLTLAVLIQDDLIPSASNETKILREFIRRLPKGSRVMVGYIRTGTLDVRQKFATDLEKVAASLRQPLSSVSAAPFNPYVEIIEGLGRFESQPAGRRAMLVISDGLDISRGLDSSSAGQSIDLQRAISNAQRRAVAVYSIFVPSITAAGNQALIANAQSSLQRLSQESGGRAFFQGLGAPVSFDPFLADVSSALDRQMALTYLSTHAKKGFHRLQIRSSIPGIELSYPSGYTR